jgi:sugar phosphate isomerase/epimerase
MADEADGPGIGVVMEAFLDLSLDEVCAWLAREAPEVTCLEVGAGGYAPHPHCDVDLLLRDASARRAWLEGIARHGLRVGALNVWGNPLHPDPAVAAQHDADLRNAARLATLLGVQRVVAMAGCPGGEAADRTPNFGSGGWLPYLEGVYERQWQEQTGPYWQAMGESLQAENPDLLVCLELHPGTAVYNVETFERLAALSPSIAANLDPSHFMWMGMDAHRVGARIRERVGHMHGKDVVFHDQNLALNGLLDRRWPNPPEEMPWTFAVPGQGHDEAWWTGLLTAVAGSPLGCVSIEHEDPFVPARVGVPQAARFLRAALDAARAEIASHDIGRQDHGSAT